MDAIYDPRNGRALVEPIRRAYLLHGDDDAQKDEAIATIKSAVLDPTFADFDFEQLDAEASSVEAVLASAAIAPFASPKRMVVVRASEAYRRRERQQDAVRLAEGIGALPGLSVLVLRVGADDESAKGKTALTPKIDAAVREAGMLVRFRALSSDGLRAWLDSLARDAGKSLDEEAGNWLIEATHGERRALGNEMEKAICYVGSRPGVTVEDVAAVCSYDAQDVLFKLVDAVGARNADRALHLLGEVLRFDSKPQAVSGRLLALLARQLRLLWQANELTGRGVRPGGVRSLPADLAAELPGEGGITSVAWKAADLFRQASAWNREQLCQAFDMIVRCDLANKGGTEGSADVVTNVQMLIVRLCAR